MKDRYAILLVRVSTLSQDYKPQIEDLERYAKSMGYNKFHVIETKESGLVDLDKKIGANQLFHFVKDNPQYKVVFATEISRLGRRQSILHQIKEWFIKNQIQFYAKDTGYSLLDENGKTSVGGELMFSLYGLFAENEIKQRKERFTRAKKSLMEMGYSISGKTLFGYEKVKTENNKSTLILHKVNSEIVRKIYNWYINGINIHERSVSIKRISIECIKNGFPKYTHSKRNVNKLLKEEAYTGHKITNNKRKNPNYNDDIDKKEEKYIITNNSIKYPKIIDEETFNQVQRRLKENNSKVEKSSIHTTILSKLIVCNKCQNHFNADYRNIEGRNVSSYRCSSRSRTTPCGNKHSISMKMIDSSIWSLIKSDMPALSKLISNINPDEGYVLLKSQKDKLEERIKEIDDEVSSLKIKFKRFGMMKNIQSIEILDTIEDRMLKLDKERGLLDNEISKILVSLSVKNMDMESEIKRIKENLHSIEKSKDLLKKYVNLFIYKIEIILHNSRFSIFKVKFKYFTNTVRSIDKKGNVVLSELKLNTFLILDKTITQDIKLFKSVYSIVLIGKDEIMLADLQNVKKRKFLNILLGEIDKPIYKSYFKSIEPVNLGIY